jgi:hypothetical protein
MSAYIPGNPPTVDSIGLALIPGSVLLLDLIYGRRRKRYQVAATSCFSDVLGWRGRLALWMGMRSRADVARCVPLSYVS